MTGTYLVVIAFVVAMIYLGWIGMKKTKNLNDFFLAGRNLGPWISAFSYGTTYFSAVIFVGFAGKLGWGFGMNVLWISIGNVVLGTTLAWLVLARRTRNMTARLNVMTMPEFLEARYKSPALKPFAALVIFVCLIPYSASVYTGLAYLFETNLNLPFFWSLMFIAILTGIYLIMGGYHAINIADMIQGVIMIVGALLMVYFLTASAGGPLEATRLQKDRYWQHFQRPGEVVVQTPPAPASAPEALPAADQPAPEAPKPKKPSPGPWWMLLSLVALTSLGPWGLPQMVQRYYSIKNPSIIPKAMIVTTIFSIIIAFVAYYCGALTHVFFSPGASETIVAGSKTIVTEVLPVAAKKGPMFDAFIPIMLQKFTPSWLMTAILLLILSASMSTLSGLVLVSSSAIAIDLFQGRNPSDERRKKALILMRILCAVFVIASVVIARSQWTFIVNMMSIAWGAVAGCFLAPYFYGLYWKKATKFGVWAGMISALLITGIGFFKYGAGMSPVYGAISMVAPLIIVPLVSLITSPPSAEHLTFAFGEKSEKEGEKP